MALLWLHILFFATTTFIFNFAFSTVSEISLENSCASILPADTIPKRLQLISHRGLPLHHGHYMDVKGSSQSQSSLFHVRNMVSFHISKIYTTHVQGLLDIEGDLTVQGTTAIILKANMSEDLEESNFVDFRLHGFWSESSGKLCMVNSVNTVNLPAVFKLYNLKNSTSLTSLITGSLESLSSDNGPNYFETISIMMLPQMNYEYTVAFEEIGSSFFNKSDVVSGLSLHSLSGKGLCSLTSITFNLRYESHCSTYAKNCIPFGVFVDILPSVMSLGVVQCSEEKNKLRVQMFWSNLPDLRTPMVGEATWDSDKNQLYVVACRYLGIADSFIDARIGDCSTRLSLKFPAIRTIDKPASVVGHIWSIKTVESGYFDTIRVSSDSLMTKIWGVKYEYTKIDKLHGLCARNTPAENKRTSYPRASSHDMRIYMEVSSNNSKIGWGNSSPNSLNNQVPLFHTKHRLKLQRQPVNAWRHTLKYTPPNFLNLSYENPVNMSYMIYIWFIPYENLGGVLSLLPNASSTAIQRVEISAEGIYDHRTGSLCMIGCRKLGLGSQLSVDESMDCEILVKFQFSPRNLENNVFYFNGSIESTREKSSPHYFERLELSNAPQPPQPFCKCEHLRIINGSVSESR